MRALQKIKKQKVFLYTNIYDHKAFVNGSQKRHRTCHYFSGQWPTVKQTS